MPIKARNGMSLTTEREQLERWKEHFSEILNQNEPDTSCDLGNEHARDMLNVNLSDISLEEVRSALRKLKNNKAAGADDIQPELLRHGGKTLEMELLHLFKNFGNKKESQRDWDQGVIVTIPKKGDLSDCNSWRGITLLSILGKVFCTILLDRLKSELDAILREEQAGFRRGRSCIEQILTLRNIIEQTIEFKAQIVLNFIDFRKAFDSVHRDTLWEILKFYGVPGKFITIFKGLYENSRSCVRTNVGTTDYFNVYNGVTQGCVLSPVFFLLVIDFVMTKAMNLECVII